LRHETALLTRGTARAVVLGIARFESSARRHGKRGCMTWTKERHEAVKVRCETPNVHGWGDLPDALAEIERLTAKASVCEWQHRPCVDCGAMGTFVGQGLYECWKCTSTELKAERDTARAELHACGLELQTCRATLEEERRDGDVQRAEIERLTAELAGQSKATLDWREAAKRHMARAADLERELANLRRTVNEGIEITHDQAIKIDAQKAEIERLTAELAGVRASYQARETEWRERRVVLDPSERPPADASLEARAKIAMLAHDASPPAVFGGPWENAAPECHAAWIAVVRAVDASRPAPGISVQIAMALAPDGDVTEQARAVRRIAGERQGLTEEQIETLAKSFDAKAEAEMTLAAEHREEPAEWQHRAVSIAWDEAAALLRAERSALAPGDVAIPRAILERLAKAAASDPDARWAAERILQRATLAAEPARTDPEAARQLAERHFLIIGPALREVIGCTSSRGIPSPREVGEPGATFREVSVEACPLCAVVGGAK